MFDFATAVVVEVVDVIQLGLGLIDPTTMIGGVITLGLVGGFLIRAVRRLASVAKGF